MYEIYTLTLIQRSLLVFQRKWKRNRSTELEIFALLLLNALEDTSNTAAVHTSYSITSIRPTDSLCHQCSLLFISSYDVRVHAGTKSTLHNRPVFWIRVQVLDVAWTSCSDKSWSPQLSKELSPALNKKSHTDKHFKNTQYYWHTPAH